MTDKGIVNDIAETILGNGVTDVDEIVSIGVNVALGTLPDGPYGLAIEGLGLLGAAFTKLAKLGADKKLTVQEIAEVKMMLKGSKLLETIFTTVLRKLARVG